MTYQNKLDQLITLIRDASTRIKTVTTDPASVRPSNAGVTVCIHPPDVEFDQWGVPDYVWTLWLIAGRAWSQDKAARELLETIEELTAANLNMNYAQPVTFSIDNVGELAGYEIKLNKLDIEGD